jgi:nucleoside-diphosphate-sugar epimerase
MKIAVTGATGYIGRRVVASASKSGHEVISLSRRPDHPFSSNWFPYDLSATEHIFLPEGVEVLIHLAANTSFRSGLSAEEEIFAAQKLVNLTKDRGIKFIFISSQTARSDAPTAYGRVKFQIEQKVIEAQGLVIRPGLVYGGTPNGLYGELIRSVNKFYFLPLFFPGPKVQPIHVDDLTWGILRVAELHSNNFGPVIMLGSIEPVSFGRFLGGIAKARLRVTRLFIPIPSIVIIMMSGVFSKLGGSLNRINSLFNLASMDTRSDLNFLGLSLRPLDIGLHASGSAIRRQLILEGHAFYAYLVGEAPKKIYIRHYVRIIEKLRKGLPLQIPFSSKFWPFLIGVLDRKNSVQSKWIEEYRWRLSAVTLLAEASSRGAINFLGNKVDNGFLVSLLGIMSAILIELFFRLSRLLLAPLIKIIFSEKLKRADDS